MYFYLIVFYLVTFCLPFGLWAEEPLTIEEAVVQALAENPRLKASAAQVEAAKARIGVARSLEDPMVGVEFEEVPITTSDITKGMMTNYEVRQKLPFPSKLITQGKVAKKSYLAEESSYRTETVDLLVQTEHAFHQLYLVDRSLQINRELQGLFQKLAASEKAKYQTGDNTSQNFLKAKVELEKLRSEGALLKAERIEALSMLNILRNKNPKEEVRLAELPRADHTIPSYEILEKRLLEKHPELKAAQLQTEAARANITLAKQSAWIPDLEARFAYNQRYGQVDAWSAQAMITIPFLWGKNRKALKEAKAMKQFSEQTFLNLQNERLAMLQESYAKLESAKESNGLFQNRILPNSKLALKSAEAAYQTGKDDFLSLIDAAREFKEAKFGALTAFVDYHKAMTHLKLAIGENFNKEVL